MTKKFFINFIRFYQKIKFCYFPNHVGVCRFYPCCSEYAISAIKKYGALKGSFLAFGRILRCNPFSKGGYDPLK